MTATRTPSPVDDAVGWTAVGVLGLGAASMFAQRVLDVGPAACALRAALGVPCPTCGLSTIVAQVARADVGGAVAHDPLGVVLLAALGVLTAVHLARLIGVGASLRFARPAWAVPLALGVLLAGRWALTLSGVVVLAPLP